MTKINTLKDYIENALDETVIEITESYYQDNLFEVETETETFEFLVLTDEEADEKASEEITGTLWAFNPTFILNNSHLTDYSNTWDEDEQIEKGLKLMQENLCENANPLIKAIIGDELEDFIQCAIDEDGRGHFLSTYDGEEIELDDYFIYRVN